MEKINSSPASVNRVLQVVILKLYFVNLMENVENAMETIPIIMEIKFYLETFRNFSNEFIAYVAQTTNPGLFTKLKLAPLFGHKFSSLD